MSSQEHLQKFLAGLDPRGASSLQKFLRRQDFIARAASGLRPGAKPTPAQEEQARQQAQVYAQLQQNLARLRQQIPPKERAPLSPEALFQEETAERDVRKTQDELALAEVQRSREAQEIKEGVAELYGEDDGPAYDPTPKNKVFNRVNPSYNKQRNILGGTAVAVPGGPSLPVAWFMADEEDATVLTVTSFSRAFGFGVVATDQVRPYMKITWGTRISPLATLISDIGLGTQLSLCGSAFFVEVGFDLGTQGAVTPLPATAMIGFNTTQRQSPSTRTGYIDSLGAGQTKTFSVPLFAVTVLSCQRSDPAAAITLTFRDALGNIAFEVVIATNAFSAGNFPVQLSGDVVTVDVLNGGANPINGRLIFGLSA